MKGHPGSGKSTIARSLGRALHWPVLDKDDIRDCSQILETALPPPIASSLLNSFSYLALWQIAHTQLQLGLSVIVDCPLSRPSLFLSASSLASLHSHRLVIIECVASDPQEWKRRLEARATESAKACNGSDLLQVSDHVGTSENDEVGGSGTKEVLNLAGNEGLSSTEICLKGWHKPRCWEDLQSLILNYEGCWEYDTASAKKLIVDTTSLCQESVGYAVLHWIRCVTDETPAVTHLP